MAHEGTLRNRRILSDAEDTLTISGTQDRSTELAPGLYSLTCDTDVYFLQGPSDVTATSSSNPLWSKERAEIEVRYGDKDGYISAIQQSAGGTLWITKIHP